MVGLGDNLILLFNNPKSSKEEIIKALINYCQSLGLTIQEVNAQKPWGAYLRFADINKDLFLDTFFTNIETPNTLKSASLSPKFLLVAPNKRLSWQVHQRRSEFWRVLHGPVGVKRSETDDQPEEEESYQIGETVVIGDKIRHR